MQPNLLAEIEAFLEAKEMSPTRFGAEATGDRHLVRQLRNGRRLWPETADRIRKYMAAYVPPEREAA